MVAVARRSATSASRRTTRRTWSTATAAALLIGLLSAPAGADRAYVPPVPTDHWWPGDGSTADVVAGLDGSSQGGAGYRVGHLAQAFDFDGVDDLVAVPSDPSTAVSGSFTIAAWVYIDVASDFVPIVAKWNDVGINHRSYALWAYQDHARFDVSSNGLFGDPGSRLVLAPNLLPVGTWTFVAGVFDAPGHTMRLYVDGAEVGSVSTSFGSVFTSTEPLMIGAGDLGGAQRHFTKGGIDEVQFFDRALSATDVQAVQQMEFVTAVKNVQIDVRPGDDTNTINLKTRGSVPVAVLTTPDFDAATVDSSSLVFAGAHVTLKPDGTLMAMMKDVDGDGDLDLLAFFDVPSLTALTPASTEATLTGSTTAGDPIAGSSAVRVLH